MKIMEVIEEPDNLQVLNGIEGKNLSPEEQAAAAFLRQRFLYLMASLPSKSANIGMYGKTSISGQIRAFDQSFENAVVENLQPPNSQPVIPRVIVRTSDIMTISYEDV